MWRLLNGFEYFLIFSPAVSASISVSISVFASLVRIPVSIASFAVGLKVCTLIERNWKLLVNHQEKRKKHDNKVLLVSWNLPNNPKYHDDFKKTWLARPERTQLPAGTFHTIMD